MRTAACLVIGNEILSGKVEEKNVARLARELFSLGISLRRVIVCPDEIPTIARDLDALRAAHDYVFTSGGIGPTHDDITIDAVAHAFGVPLDRDPRIADAIRAYYGDATTEHHLRMANVPRGGDFAGDTDPVFTTLRIGNVFVLPGVPMLFARKLEGLRPLLDRGESFVNRTVFLRGDEGDYAAALEAVAAEFPDVSAGSYLAPPAPSDYDCRVTFDAADVVRAQAAADAFVARVGTVHVIRRGESGAA